MTKKFEKLEIILQNKNSHLVNKFQLKRLNLRGHIPEIYVR